jgi:hypothetical protein
MASTNWYLEHRSTRLLNGPEGMSRHDARPFAVNRISVHVRDTTSVVLPEPFALDEALDRLAVETGATGWLEKTPLHVLSIAEIESDIPDARFVHLVRDPAGVVTSLLRRARDNEGMVGRAHQSNQSNDEAVWRECVHATLERHGKGNHFVVDAESFVDDPEMWAVRIAAFLDLPYRSPEHPARVRAAGAAKASHRPWKADAAGPVQRIAHDDAIALAPLDPRTVDLWAHARQVLGITSGGVSAAVPGSLRSGGAEPAP